MQERPQRVAVFGGGVAGLSAAHELLARSSSEQPFEIELYERHPGLAGGKARSVPVPGSGTDGRSDLPGEHGFRFFPGFYRHLPDTLRAIPCDDGRSVYDRLVALDRVELARFDQPSIVCVARFPHDLGDLRTTLHDLFDTSLGTARGEIDFFALRLWQMITSCEARRFDEYERISWWDYVGAESRSTAYQNLLANGLSRSLQANDPRHASARTVGQTGIQLLLDILEPGQAADRILDAPTNEAWITPWLRHLARGSGFVRRQGVEAVRIECEGGRIAGVQVRTKEGQRTVTADFYVFAVPVEQMAEILTRSRAARPDDPIALDPGLGDVVTLGRNVAWMNGIQFYLRRDAPIVSGHTLYADAPWALASISQAQFWPGVDLARLGDGQVRGIVSVCISDWDRPGILHGRAARDCTRAEIAEEVWAQLQRSLNVNGRTLLADDDLHSFFLDPDIRDDPAERRDAFRNLEPLFINVAGSWALRPEARTRIPNLFLASDYVRTHTDVACMEAANEAARRAVNAVLESCGSRAAPCRIWPLHEPALLAPLRWRDEERYGRGLPWSEHLFR